MYQALFDAIKKYEHIVIYRHINPDLDAYGSQFGLKAMIEDTFKEKKVYVAGEDHLEQLSKLNIRHFEKKPDSLKGYLAIVLDTANRQRIDGSLDQADFIVKVDHHIVVDSYGQLNIEFPHASSTCEVVTDFYDHFKDILSLGLEAATCLYTGIVSDTNRFMYDSVSQKTFAMVQRLIETGICITDIYDRIYLEHETQLEVKKTIYQSYKKSGQVAYYILLDEDLKRLHISRQTGSECVNLLSNIMEFDVWFAVTEDIEKHQYRVSLRSRNVAVNEIAMKYRGGGHRLASGATLLSLDELPLLLKDLNNAIELTTHEN